MHGDGGAILGGYLTYRMASQSGKETLEKRCPKKKTARVYAIFGTFGGPRGGRDPRYTHRLFPSCPFSWRLEPCSTQHKGGSVWLLCPWVAAFVTAILAYLGPLRTSHREFCRAVLLACASRFDCFSVSCRSFVGLFEYKRRHKVDAPKAPRPTRSLVSGPLGIRGKARMDIKTRVHRPHH